MGTAKPFFERLNGWQRLWIVLAVVWLIGASAFAVMQFPTEQKWRAAWRLHTYERTKELQQPVAEIEEHCRKSSSEANYILDFSKCMDASRLQYQNAKTHYKDQTKWLYDEGERRVGEDLPREQLKTIGFSIALWIVPLLALYALGLGVAWVRKGFSRGV